MKGMGDRLRARGRQLGWSDSEIARRSNIGQTSYANYLADRHEPDLATFARICGVLGIPPAELLGQPIPVPDEVAGLRERVTAAMNGMDAATLGLLAAVADRFIATSARPIDAGRAPRPATRRRKVPTPAA
jgi:transcriptional regulator with XRE-family HTH domain